LALDKLLEMFSDDVARRRGCLPVDWLLGYQGLIVAVSGFRPGPTQLAVKRSSSKNDFLLTADFAYISQINRLKTSILCNSGQHPRTYFLTIMESKDEIGISITSKSLM
jgi:hypothetical protein